MKYKKVTWEEVERVVDFFKYIYETRNLEYDYIYGVPRGGLVLATMLSHAIKIPMLVDVSSKLSDKKILVIDDIADTGNTLNLIKKSIPNSIAFTMYYHQRSVVEPYTWLFEKTDKWIVYPWEVSYHKDTTLI